VRFSAEMSFDTGEISCAFRFLGRAEVTLQEPRDCKAWTQMMTLGSEFIVKSFFVLKSAALAVDDAFSYMPPYGKPVVGKPAIKSANTKNFLRASQTLNASFERNDLHKADSHRIANQT
jgi:hypothetical protein